MFLPGMHMALQMLTEAVIFQKKKSTQLRDMDTVLN